MSSRLSRYEIHEKLGEGSAGEVYLAQDKTLDRPVVLKVLAEQLEADEARSAVALDHPFICKIYEIDEERGRSFIAMEYVAGETLAVRLKRDAVPLPDALRIASEIAEALETAHEKAVVHRDLKASNIMLTGEGHAKVMDFGLSRRVEAAGAPSDIHAFGVVLHEMLADGPEHVKHLIDAMLAKAPEERPSASEVRATLGRTPLPHPRAPTRKLAPLALLALVAIVIALTVWLVPRGPQSIAVLPLENLSEDPLETDYVAEGITRAVITKLTQAGMQVTPWATAQRYGASEDTPERIAEELNVDAVLLGTFALEDEQIRTTLSLVDRGSGLQTWAEQFEEPFENIFRVQERIAVGAATSLKRRLTGEEEEILARPESLSIDAYDLFLQGAQLLQDGTQEATAISGEYFTQSVALDPNLAAAHVGLGSVHYARYYFGWGGLDSLTRAQASYEEALELNPTSMEARRGLINVYSQKGDIEAVLIQGREAARIGRPHDLETLLTRAHAYQLGENFSLDEQKSRSVTLYREVLEIDPVNAEARWRLVTAAWGPQNEDAIPAANDYFQRFGDDPEIHMYVAHAHHLLGNYDAARKHYEKATGPATVERALEAILFAGVLYEQLGEPQRAEEAWRRGLEIVKPKLEPFPDNLRMRLLSACFHGLLGEREAMLVDEGRALETAEFGTWQLHELAFVHAKRGDPERAVELLHRSLREGFVYRVWEAFFAMGDLPIPESEAWREFLQEFDAEARRLMETY